MNGTINRRNSNEKDNKVNNSNNSLAINVIQTETSNIISKYNNIKNKYITLKEENKKLNIKIEELNDKNLIFKNQFIISESKNDHLKAIIFEIRDQNKKLLTEINGVYVKIGQRNKIFKKAVKELIIELLVEYDF